MNQEDMANELSRILGIMCGLDPTTEKYGDTLDHYSKLMDTFHKELASCDSDLDHRTKRKVDEKMIELKEVELKLREMDTKDNMKKAKREAWFSLIKIGLVILGMLLGIIITGSLEQSTILSQKCLSFVRMLAPKIM